MAVGYAFTPTGDNSGKDVWGAKRAVYGVLTLSGTYTTPDGEAIGATAAAAAALFGLSRLDTIIFLDQVTSAGNLVRYTDADRKLEIFESAATGLSVIEKTDDEALSGTIRVLALGK